LRYRLTSHLAAIVSLVLLGGRVGAAEYPLQLELEASAESDMTQVKSTVVITIDRLMLPSRRARAMDALAHTGYAGFLTLLRSLPPVGTIAVGNRKVEVRYAHEEPRDSGRRLVVVADQPLFFLGGGDKARAGYELTMVELMFDATGGVTGRMAGAARVKPDRTGAPLLDDYAERPVRLTNHIRPQR